MSPTRFQTLSRQYRRLRIAVIGDFCLDRYLEIDPARQETSIETNLPVHNVVNVRSQPGAAGTILNNLVALGVGEIYPVGFAGSRDGEGLELTAALSALRGVNLDYFLRTPYRRTFTYTKPLVLQRGHPPEELSRLDFKNWTPTPPPVERHLIRAAQTLARRCHAFILLDQVDTAGTGVVTRGLLKAIREISRRHPGLLIIGDSRRGLRGFPPVTFKMNAKELAAFTSTSVETSFQGRANRRGIRDSLDGIKLQAATLARSQKHLVFVTLAERGILGASPAGEVEHSPALPIRGEIDIVGAGDAVTANLAAALAAGADLRESLDIANAAASIVVHQLGTTGTARVPQITALLR